MLDKVVSADGPARDELAASKRVSRKLLTTKCVLPPAVADPSLDQQQTETWEGQQAGRTRYREGSPEGWQGGSRNDGDDVLDGVLQGGPGTPEASVEAWEDEA